MMQAIKQSSLPSLPYYILSYHKAGSRTSPNSIQIVAPTHIGAFKYKHTKSVESNVVSSGDLPYSASISYEDNDKVFTTVPYNKITELRMRFNQVKTVIPNFSSFTELELIWLRGNLMYWQTLDLQNNSKIKTLDVSDNYMDYIMLHPDAPIDFVYIGGLVMSGQPDERYVISRIQDQIHERGLLNGQILSDACTCYGSDAHFMHETLVSRGWDIGHISYYRKTGSYFANETNKDYNFSIMSSKYNWQVIEKPSWVNASTTLQNKSNTITNFFVGVYQNISGVERVGNIVIAKKKDDGNEYKGRVTFTITQSGQNI